MSALLARSVNSARGREAPAPRLLRRRLASRSDVKRATRARASQNRQLMRGGLT